MVGLGDTRDEILQVMDDLHSAGVDFLTIGQYLAPSREHAEVKRYMPPAEFEELKRVALAKGFLVAASRPLDAFAAYQRAMISRGCARPAGAVAILTEVRRCRASAPSATFPYPRTEMFDVVANVARYPEFLPLCDSLVREEPH